MFSVRTNSKPRDDASNAEFGIPSADLRVTSWPCCIASIGPLHAVAALALAIGCALTSIAAALGVEETRSTLERQGYEIVGVGPAEFGAAVRTDLDQNRKLFASGRIKLE